MQLSYQANTIWFNDKRVVSKKQVKEAGQLTWANAKIVDHHARNTAFLMFGMACLLIEAVQQPKTSGRMYGAWAWSEVKRVTNLLMNHAHHMTGIARTVDVEAIEENASEFTGITSTSALSQMMAQQVRGAE